MARLEYDGNIGRVFMNEGASEVVTAGRLPDPQRLAIVGTADIRRQSQTLGGELDRWRTNAGYEDLPVLKGAYEDQYRLVTQAMQGGNTPALIGNASDSESIIASHLATATAFAAVPNFAALRFAKVAALQQAAGMEYGEALEKARQALDTARKQGIPQTTPADYLPQAIILGIAKKAAAGVEIPSPKEIAHAISADPSLLKDYALVLPESQRAEFLEAFPESRRAEISLQLDRAVSEVLNKRVISDEADVTQRDAVKDRVQQAFEESLVKLKTADGEVPRSLEGRPIGHRWTSKQLTETVINLGEEDSLRLLRDLSEGTTRELKELNKQHKKLPPDARAHALGPSLSFTARVLDTLIDVDIKRGGVLTMRYLEMTALPDRLFTFFAKKLVGKEYLSQHLLPFLTQPENIPVIKKLMAKYGPQFNTIVDTITQVSDYSLDHKLPPHETELFEALADLSTLTPRIFSRYRQLPLEQRKAFAEKIRTLKPQFFKNTPIKGILAPSDRDILTEMVYMAYKPMGMSFEQVEGLIKRVDDHTDDIAWYTFPEEGYPLTLERQGRYMIKEKQQPDLSALRRYRALLTAPAVPAEREADALTFAQACQLILQPASPDQERGQLARNSDEALRTLLTPLQAQSRVQEFLGRYGEVSADTAFPIEGELAEIMGVYFKDNYNSALDAYLNTHPAEFQQIVSLLSDPQVRASVDERLRQYNTEVNWQELDQTAQPSSGGLLSRFFTRSTPVTPTSASVARVLTQIIEHEQIEPIRKHIKNELSKFTLNTQEGTSNYRGVLRAYVSKNVGSFFAKAAAGICTAQDIPLFEREDHFHINVVENNEAVRANVQAYIAIVNGKPSLVLRGFNPTADWVGKIDIESFCEQILDIGREFQQTNGLGGLYITDQDGGWHALSNREQVGRYMVKKYVEGKPATSLSLNIASEHSVNKVYQV